VRLLLHHLKLGLRAAGNGQDGVQNGRFEGRECGAARKNKKKKKCASWSWGKRFNNKYVNFTSFFLLLLNNKKKKKIKVKAFPNALFSNNRYYSSVNWDLEN